MAACPSLRRLDLKRCVKLRSAAPLAEFSSVREVCISGCSGLDNRDLQLLVEKCELFH